MQVLTGSGARLVFIEAYQYILRLQCRTLIEKKGLPQDIEDVVKGLWTLRTQLLPRHNMASTVEAHGDYSSQTIKKGPREDDHASGRRVHKLDGQELPSLIETLGLLYLATHILRLPTSLGDVYR